MTDTPTFRVGNIGDVFPEDMQRFMQAVKEMMDVHFDPDEDPVLMENWPKTSDEKKCFRCRFRGICHI